MRTLFTFLVFTFLSLQAFGAQDQQQTLFCPMVHAMSLKSKLPTDTSDKFKHCALSCQLALRCSALGTMHLGILKEVWDLFTPGNAEWEDLKADARGIRFAFDKRAVTDKECNQQCKNIYW